MSPPAAMGIRRPVGVVGLIVVIASVAALRLVPILAHDWPLGDGGLFYSMIGDVVGARFALPDVVSYQGGAIPFAYPPLAFYVAGVIEVISQAERSDILRVLPPIAAVACVPAMYLVGTELGPSWRHALVAAAYFGALVGLTTFLASGGGLTRSVGLLLSLLAIWQGFRLYSVGHWRTAAATAILGGLALLSHPEAGPMIAIALGSALATHWSSRALGQTLVVALGAALIASPWIVTVVSRHGIEPFLSATASTRTDSLASIVMYGFFFLLSSPVIGVLDIVGQVRQAMRRRLQLLLWRIGVFAFDLRYSPIAAAAPVSMLAAHGTLDVLVPFALRLVGSRRAGGLSSRQRRSWRRAIVTAAIVLAFVPSVSGSIDAIGSDAALTPGQRAAMTWVRDHTPDTTRVVVLSDGSWGSDMVSEWFPSLSERISATTGQGFEWGAGALHETQAAAEDDLRACRGIETAQSDCVDAWVRRRVGTHETVLYLASSSDRAGVDGGCCDALALELVASRRYRPLWHGEAATILAPVDPGAQRSVPVS